MTEFFVYMAVAVVFFSVVGAGAAVLVNRRINKRQDKAPGL